MYISDRNGAFDFSENNICAVIKICEPLFYENSTVFSVPFVGSENGYYLYSDTQNQVKIKIEKKSDNLFYIKRIWKNLSDKNRNIQTVFKIKNLYKAEKYMIPCVSINGNEFGDGNEPKGMYKNGEKWIFAYDRVAIPSCTVVENSDYCTAVFVSDETARSLTSSCSVSKEEENFIQEIIHPVKEAPLRYSARDEYAPAVNTYISLNPSEEFECGIYLSVSKPRWKNFGICRVLDDALELFKKTKIDRPDDESLWNYSITYAESLIDYCKGIKGFNMGYHLKDGFFKYRFPDLFQLAWCGHNILFCRMFIKDYIKTGNEQHLNTALEILDNWVKYCSHESGLIAEQLKDSDNLNSALNDTCNLGYGALEFLRTYILLKSIGIEKEEYFNAAKGICDFFCEHYSDEWGFGKLWSLRGEIVKTGGTIGAFVVCPLAEIYAFTGNKKYLEFAERGLKFYAERDLDNFICTAGALDTCCVDKETSCPLIISSIRLYEITGNKYYLEYAQKAAYYFTSWMLHYQPVYDNKCDVSKHGVILKGLTFVSTQHHHLDMYASLLIPQFRKLAHYSGDIRWKKRAELMWDASLQLIGDGKLTVHSHIRPIGSQNEAIFQADWNFTDFRPRGSLNDWLVSWPCAYRLSTLSEYF